MKLEEICGDLNKMFPISLGHLNTWSSAGGCFEGLGGAALLKKRLWSFNRFTQFPVSFLSFLFAVQDVSPQLLPQL